MDITHRKATLECTTCVHGYTSTYTSARILIDSGFRLGYSLVYTLRVCDNVLQILPELFSVGVDEKVMWETPTNGLIFKRPGLCFRVILHESVSLYRDFIFGNGTYVP